MFGKFSYAPLTIFLLDILFMIGQCVRRIFFLYAVGPYVKRSQASNFTG